MPSEVETQNKIIKVPLSNGEYPDEMSPSQQLSYKESIGIPLNLPIRTIYYHAGLKVYTLNPEVLPILGMTYIPNFLNPQEQEALLNQVNSRSFCRIIHRRQQFYGPTYYHTTPNISSLQPVNGGDVADAVVDPYKKGDSSDGGGNSADATHDIDLLKDMNDKLIDLGFFSNPLPPTQVLVNEYIADCGISNHFDDSDAFDDTIATISLGKPIWMKLQMPSELTNHDRNVLKETTVLLEPGSLFVMQKDVRYRWRHGIPKSRWIQLPDGTFNKRDQDWVRVSLTFRRLKDGRKRVEEDSRDWVDIGERKPYDSIYDYESTNSTR